MSGATSEPAKGYAEVDAQPHAAAMVAGMEATARWPAVQALRLWEREHLALRPGDRLLDVGCGIGDVSTALVADVSPVGEVVGIDASETMLDAARSRALVTAPGTALRFRIGDALDLGEPDASFDAVRAERVLQWLPRPADAIAEMTRVLAPGGRLSLIDSDWRTLMADLPASADAGTVTGAMLASRGDSATVGGRLLNLVREAGLVEVSCTGAVHVWTAWDPDTQPGPAGLFPFKMAVGQLVEQGSLPAETAERFVSAADAAARADRFFLSLTMFAVSGRKP